MRLEYECRARPQIPGTRFAASGEIAAGGKPRRASVRADFAGAGGVRRKSFTRCTMKTAGGGAILILAGVLVKFVASNLARLNFYLVRLSAPGWIHVWHSLM